MSISILQQKSCFESCVRFSIFQKSLAGSDNIRKWGVYPLVTMSAVKFGDGIELAIRSEYCFVISRHHPRSRLGDPGDQRSRGVRGVSLFSSSSSLQSGTGDGYMPSRKRNSARSITSWGRLKFAEFPIYEVVCVGIRHCGRLLVGQSGTRSLLQCRVFKDMHSITYAFTWLIEGDIVLLLGYQ